MIHITQNITIDEREIQQDFIRASGPGGQNVNKVATAVQLRFDVKNSPSLSNEVRERLVRLAGKRITDEGVLIITARRFRQQERNRQEAYRRLVALIVKATEIPKTRRPTKPTAASKKRRLNSKHHHSKIKQLRQEREKLEE